MAQGSGTRGQGAGEQGLQDFALSWRASALDRG